MNPYNTPEWKQVRLQVLARDGHRCQLRLGKCKGRATHVDHVTDWRDDGPLYDPANLRAACASCNVAQRNTRVAARARAQRGEPTTDNPGAWEHPARVHGPNSWCEPGCPAQHPSGPPLAWAT